MDEISCWYQFREVGVIGGAASVLRVDREYPLGDDWW